MMHIILCVCVCVCTMRGVAFVYRRGSTYLSRFLSLLSLYKRLTLGWRYAQKKFNNMKQYLVDVFFWKESNVDEEFEQDTMCVRLLCLRILNFFWHENDREKLETNSRWRFSRARHFYIIYYIWWCPKRKKKSRPTTQNTLRIQSLFIKCLSAIFSYNTTTFIDLKISNTHAAPTHHRFIIYV